MGWEFRQWDFLYPYFEVGDERRRVAPFAAKGEKCETGQRLHGCDSGRFRSARAVRLRSTDIDPFLGYAKLELACHFGVQLLVKAEHESVPLLSDLSS